MDIAFHPIVGAKDRPVLFETLMRPQSQNGSMNPAEFVAAAERIGPRATLEIDHVMLCMAVRTAAQRPDARLTVNVSGKTIDNPDWLLVVKNLLDGNPKLAKRLNFEITETAQIKNRQQAARFCDSMRKMGVGIILDDVGTGIFIDFSPFKDLQPDWVKIAREVTLELTRDRKPEAFKALVRQAEIIGAGVIAEGIESAADAQLARNAGADALQGYYYGRPGAIPPPIIKRMPHAA